MDIFGSLSNQVDGRLHNRLCSIEVAGTCSDFVFALSKAITHTMAAGAPDSRIQGNVVACGKGIEFLSFSPECLT